MAMYINTNMNSLITQKSLDKTSESMQNTMLRLSTGLRINSAKDDSSGMAITTKMTTQIRGMTVAQNNANDGMSMAQTADGALAELTSTLQRMRDLALKSANTGGVSKNDRQKLNDEFKQMGQELKRQIDNTSFAGLKIFAGGATGVSGKMFQVGWSTAIDNRISITISALSKMSGVKSAIAANFSIGSTVGSTAVLSRVNSIDLALNKINDSRAKLGATQNRFQAAISNLQQSIDNNSAARSRIMDADFAVETSNLSRTQILQQAGSAMLTQANQSGQQVLSLLR